MFGDEHGIGASCDQRRGDLDGECELGQRLRLLGQTGLAGEVEEDLGAARRIVQGGIGRTVAQGLGGRGGEDVDRLGLIGRPDRHFVAGIAQLLRQVLMAVATGDEEQLLALRQLLEDQRQQFGASALRAVRGEAELAHGLCRARADAEGWQRAAPGLRQGFHCRHGIGAGQHQRLERPFRWFLVARHDLEQRRNHRILAALAQGLRAALGILLRSEHQNAHIVSSYRLRSGRVVDACRGAGAQFASEIGSQLRGLRDGTKAFALGARRAVG